MIPAAAPSSPGRAMRARGRAPYAPLDPNLSAGHKSNKSATVRSVLTGVDDLEVAPPRPREKRTEYQHPTYTIHRNPHATAVKDLLYGGSEQAPLLSSGLSTP